MNQQLKNLDLFNKQNPFDPLSIEVVGGEAIRWQISPDGEKNLICTENGQEFLLYHPDGGKIESGEFIKLLTLEECYLLIVFGVGLGYLFDELKEWLKTHPQSHLIFIEDKMEVFRAFLETERAPHLLTHAQVKVLFIDDEKKLERKFGEMLKSVLIPPGCLGGITFISLPSYRRMRFEKMDETYSRLIKEVENIERSGETRYFCPSVLYNHMTNFRFYPYGYHIQSLFNAFREVPVIVCGGGASLDTHIEFLKQIESRAIIVGVGAGSNALAEHGIIPHLTFGIDPTLRHSARLASQGCYEVPLIYSTRVHFRGLELIQSPLVVAPFEEEGSQNWVNKQLKIPRIEPFIGVSVGNFAVSIMQRLGCSPLFFLGIDLAHAQNKAYVSGWQDHPLIGELKECAQTDLRQSIFGITREEDLKPHTTNQFLLERHFYTLLAEQCPNTKFFNLSWEGFDIPSVPRISVQEAFDSFLSRTFDLRGQIHSLMIQAPLSNYRITIEKIVEQMDKWHEHLDHSYSWCQRIADRLQEECMVDENREIDPEEIIRFEKKINKSPVYENLLKEYEESYEECHALKVKWWGKKISNARKWIECYRHLADCTAGALAMMEGIRLKYRWDEKYALQRFPAAQGVAKEMPGEGDLYSLTDNELTLIDWELELAYHESLHFERGTFCFDESFYSSGGLKSKVGRFEGVLHGYSAFYSENGELLSMSWFIKGIQQGKSWRYYPSGALYSVERYRDGLREKNQEYFYESGLFRTVLPYLKGKLNGMATFYHRNGVKKREVPYAHHERFGIERFWDDNGVLRGHIKYHHNQPLGTACSWFKEGTQQMELSYFSEGVIDYVDQWDESSVYTHDQRMPIDSVVRQIDEMSDKMQNLQNQFELLAHQLPTSEQLENLENKGEIEEDLMKLGEEMKKLEQFFKKNS